MNKAGEWQQVWHYYVTSHLFSAFHWLRANQKPEELKLEAKNNNKQLPFLYKYCHQDKFITILVDWA